MKRIGKQRTLLVSRLPAPVLRCAARTAAFAQGLAARYLRNRAARRAGDLLLVSAQPLILQFILRRLGVAPAQAARAMLMPLSARAPAFDLRRDAESTRHPPRLEERPGERPAIAVRPGQQSLVLRIVERMQRIEIGARNPPGAPRHVDALRSASGFWQGGAASLPLAVPAAAGAASVMPGARPAEANFSLERGKLGATAVPGAAAGDCSHAALPRTLRAPAVAEQEIERLADRVIGAIDRRITAQRERMGRP